MDSQDDLSCTIARLRKAINERDSDIEKAAMFGKQLLEDKDKLSQEIDQLMTTNETLKQEKYSLMLDLETNSQTVQTQSSELENLRSEFDKFVAKFQDLKKETIRQNQQISNLTSEKYDLEKSQEDINHENSMLKKKVALQEQQIQGFQHQAEISVNITLKEDNEEFDIEFYKQKSAQLQEALSILQNELENAKLKEGRYISIIKELEENIIDRDKELKSYSVEIQKAREVNYELEGQIEVLKLEQTDENRKGNSVFAELDDRRKHVEKEYKLLCNRYQNLLKNSQSNRKELLNCKSQIALLLSMTSHKCQESYINRLEDQLGNSKREIESLTARLNKSLKMQQISNMEQMSFKNDDYDYLRVMHQQAQQKIKSLEDDLMTVRLQNITANDSLAVTQRSLYGTQEQLDSTKLENMKLKQQIKELTLKPDAEVFEEREPKVEILPWYKPNKENAAYTEGVSDEAIVGKIDKVDKEDRNSLSIELSQTEKKYEINNLQSYRAALQQLNRPVDSELSSNAKKANDVDGLNCTGDSTNAKYKPFAHRSKNDGKCAQQ